MTILAERRSVDGRVRWQARINAADRNRLEVVGIVEPSAVPTQITPLTDLELKQLLSGAPAVSDGAWTCVECGAANAPGRQWCYRCSNHNTAADDGPTATEATK